MTRKRFIVITGPTASGKTKAAVEVAKAFGSEIISADSMQIYKELNIGTAKTTEEEMQGIPHHMIDIIPPNEEFTVAEFQSRAFSLIDEMNSRNIIPVVAGGTGLYINSLVYDLNFSNVIKNAEIRQKYTQLADDKSTMYLYNILKEKDPDYANMIAPGDEKRIIRRLEIIDSGGDTGYDFRKYNEGYDIVMAGLTMPREILYDRINKRVDEMLDGGLVEETKEIYHKYGNIKSLGAIGYKEIVSYINGEYSFEEAVRLVKRNTRHFAKRQVTWFKRDTRINWFDIYAHSCIEDTVNDIIDYIKGKGF